ncbi:MAG: LysE family translocator [Gammaproteobacteria bacterium]
MSIEHLIAFNLALLAAILSPGPALLIAIRTTLSAGRRAGIALGCGLGLMASLWTLLALLGLDVVFTLFPWLYVLAKIVGAAYLLYIAYRMWTGARDTIDASAQPAGHAFRQGFLVNLLNPKSVLFAASVLILVFPADMSAMESLVVISNHAVVELSFYTLLAIGMSTTAVSERYLRAKRHIDRAAAVVLGSLGIRLWVGR